MRNLVLILGDQLSFTNPALDGFDPQEDRVLLIEAPGEATTVWSHKARITLFLSAMRHFANQVVDRGWQLEYVQLDDKLAPDFSQRLDAVLARLPNAIFSLFKMNIATAAPPTTPGDKAEANSHNMITEKLFFQLNC